VRLTNNLRTLNCFNSRNGRLLSTALPETSDVIKKQMKKLAIIFIVGLASCIEVDNNVDNKNTKDTLSEQIMKAVDSSDGRKYSMDDVYQKYLPATLINYIQKEHPTWSFPNENMWYPQLFKKYKTDSTLVNCISGDFDGNRNKDWALIIDQGNGILSAVAFLYEGSTYKAVQLTQIPDAGKEKIDYVLTLYKSGQYAISDPDLSPTDPNIVNLKYPAIGIGHFKELYEGGNDVFYWDEKKLKSCLIED
jgi:hypothetical protein